MSIHSIDDFHKAFTIGEKLGGGGFGNVYRGVDNRTGKPIAIKRSEVSEHKYTLQREVETARKLGRHPNLVQYYETFRFKERIGVEIDYAVMELCNGGTFDDFIKRFPNQQQIGQVFEGVLNGLEFLHSKGVIHRDIKPANIVLHYENNRVTPKLIDFGISKDIATDVSYSAFQIGTPAYMAPEQLNADPVSYSTDLWSLGIMLHQLFTGKHPFSSSDVMVADEIKRNIAQGLWSGKLPNHIPNIPQPYQAVVYKCLIKDLNERAKNVQELKGITSGVVKINTNQPPNSEIKPIIRKQQPEPIIEKQVVEKQPSKPLYKKAEGGKRFVALLLDTVFSTLFQIALAFIIIAGLRSQEAAVLGTQVFALFYIMVKDVFGKASWGRKIVGLEIVDFKTQKPASAGQKIGRQLVLVLTLGLGGIVDVLVYLANDDNRKLGDLMAGTQVVQKNK